MLIDIGNVVFTREGRGALGAVRSHKLPEDLAVAGTSPYCAPTGKARNFPQLVLSDCPATSTLCRKHRDTVYEDPHGTKPFATKDFNPSHFVFSLRMMYLCILPRRTPRIFPVTMKQRGGLQFRKAARTIGAWQQCPKHAEERARSLTCEGNGLKAFEQILIHHVFNHAAMRGGQKQTATKNNRSLCDSPNANLATIANRKIHPLPDRSKMIC